HLFLLPGPPRELQPMFRAFVMPILRSIVPASALIERRLYKIADKGESLVEEAIGERVLAIPGIELGYCARPGEVDLGSSGKQRPSNKQIRLSDRRLDHRSFLPRTKRWRK